MVDDDARNAMLEALRQLWVGAYAEACARVATIEDYVGSRLAGIESDDARQSAVAAAHKLAGTLGTFGLPAGSDLGRSIEHCLEASSPDDGTILEVAKQVVSLRAIVEAAAPDVDPPADPEDHDQTTGTAIVIGGERSLIEAVRFELQRRGLTLLSSLADAEQLQRRNQVAIVDIAGDSLAISDIAHAHRIGMVVVVVGARADFELRMALVAAGASLIVDDATDAQEIVQRAIQLRDNCSADPRVAVVDRDPAVASSLAAELAVVGCTSGTLEFGVGLSTPPDDVDAVLVGGSMHCPGVNDVLATLRADPRWDSVALIALITSPDTTPCISRVHADDVLHIADGATAIADRVRAAVQRRRAYTPSTDTLRAELSKADADAPAVPRGHALGANAVKTAIVVDDDPTIRALLEEVLKSEGFSVRCIEDGLSAAAILSDPAELNDVAFVLLDVSLPGLNGFGVLRRMRTAGTLTTVPVAMLTARTADEDVITAWELGVADHIAKPFSVPVLTRQLRKLAQDKALA